jgi:hypothetical protein
MTALAEETGVLQIGEVAGKVWHYLVENGPVPFSKLVKGIDAPRDVVMQAIGWLAREDKVVIEGMGRFKRISLR